MSNALAQDALDQIFLSARTHKAWLDQDVPDTLLNQLVDVLKWGPTASNCLPMRLVFVKSKAAKERLKPHLAEGNVEKTMTAPVCAIVGYDLEFYRHMPKLNPHNKDAGKNFKDDEKAARKTANRNGTLQGGYLIIAARALGLDAGPMSGFNNAGVDGEFFKDTAIKSNFLCNLGYGDATKLFPRAPRLEFAEMANIL